MRRHRMTRGFLSGICALVLVGAVSTAQAETVVVLVRHGERADDSRDTDLSVAGRSRANALAVMLKDAGIEAVYSTDFIRSRETARPLAELLSLPIELYDGDGLEAFAKTLRSRGSRALVVGHSDTTPELVLLLGGEPGTPIGPDEYDRLYILTL
ncbi:MAG TPA: phosphoglycerate mutase family protein, partial [Vicinamibacteria bacterium]